MHPRIFREFGRICREYGALGSVLEIGAVPGPDSLLCLDALAHAARKVGVNLDPPSQFRDFQIVQANANRLDMFESRSFDTILCNATLEHDPFFWRTLEELRRVGRPGAVVIIGVPGYASHRWLERIKRRGAASGGRRLSEAMRASTPTLVVHDYPGDYYRFSEQAVRDVFFGGMRDVKVRRVMVPPRIIGAGRLP
ncbi:MAG TPA: methyltransferase domain-containing protein [Verrucomicrobiae bacterium]|nr:methyltransferase domain-containing protein [Verrucomicrobiae bacterium]